MVVNVRDGKISASKVVLLDICIVFGEAAQNYDALGLDVLAKDARKDRDAIHNALEAAGYFDE